MVLFLIDLRSQTSVIEASVLVRTASQYPFHMSFDLHVPCAEDYIEKKQANNLLEIEDYFSSKVY